MNYEEISIEILPDGTVKSTTPKISAANHQSAHEFFRTLQRTTGGPQTASKRNKALEGHTHVGADQKAGN